MESSKRTSKKSKKASGENIGFQFNGPVSADQQTFVNGDVNTLNVNQGLSKEELGKLDQLFQPFKEQVQQVTPPEKQAEVESKVDELHTELAKGKSATSERLSKVVDGLIELVPGAVNAVASMFAAPLLSGLVGPATKLVLDHLVK